MIVNEKKMCMSIFRHMQYKEPVPSILENIFLTLKKMNQTLGSFYLYNKKMFTQSHLKSSTIRTNFFLSNHDDKSYRAKLGFEQFHIHIFLHQKI